MACGWPTYRTPTSAGFCYKCGLYQQSHGVSCSHNWIDGEKATRFALNAVRQRLFKPGVKDRIQACLMRIAKAEAAPEPDVEIANAKQERLSELSGKLKRVAENMALADDDSQRQAMKCVFEDLRKQHAQLSSEMQTLKTKANTSTNMDAEVEAAMQSFEILDELVHDASNLAAMGDIRF